MADLTNLDIDCHLSQYHQTLSNQMILSHIENLLLFDQVLYLFLLKFHEIHKLFHFRTPHHTVLQPQYL
jgi:hypothetical protein